MILAADDTIDPNDLRLGEIVYDTGLVKARIAEGFLQSAKYIVVTKADNVMLDYRDWIVHSASLDEYQLREFDHLFEEIRRSGKSLKYPICVDLLEGNRLAIAWLKDDNVIVQINR